MEDRFAQQMRKGVMGMLVLSLICQKPAHGYGLQQRLKEASAGLFDMKEGTLYPILYRLEDDGFIVSVWTQGQGRLRPQKTYAATDKGREENRRRQALWREFSDTVCHILKGGNENENRSED